MTIVEALAALGATEDKLTARELELLDTDGYVLLPGILSASQVEALRQKQAEILEIEQDAAGKEVHQEAGTDRLADLINKSPLYHVVLQQPRVLAAIAHVLNNDLQLSSLNSRSALPGCGLQSLHADWGRLQTPGDYQVCNSLWLLDDFTLENGATRVVPGTQRRTCTPAEEMGDTTAPHPDQIVLQGKAGDVVVLNSHTWHGGTLNRTDKPRRAMHGYFCRRHNPQQLDQKKYLRQETWDTLSPASRVVLGVA